MNVAFDTSAWIEYFKGSSKGAIVNNYLDTGNLITPTIVLAELSIKSAKELWDFEKYMEFIKSKSLIVGLTEGIIKECGSTYISMRKIQPSFGLVDTLILLIAKHRNAKILTSDNHFRGLDNVELL